MTQNTSETFLRFPVSGPTSSWDATACNHHISGAPEHLTGYRGQLLPDHLARYPHPVMTAPDISSVPALAPLPLTSGTYVRFSGDSTGRSLSCM